MFKSQQYLVSLAKQKWRGYRFFYILQCWQFPSLTLLHKSAFTFYSIPQSTIENYYFQQKKKYNILKSWEDKGFDGEQLWIGQATPVSPYQANLRQLKKNLFVLCFRWIKLVWGRWTLSLTDRRELLWSGKQIQLTVTVDRYSWPLQLTVTVDSYSWQLQLTISVDSNSWQ